MYIFMHNDAYLNHLARLWRKLEVGQWILNYVTAFLSDIKDAGFVFLALNFEKQE